MDSHVPHEAGVLGLHQHVPDVVGVVSNGRRQLLVYTVELIHLERNTDQKMEDCYV